MKILMSRKFDINFKNNEELKNNFKHKKNSPLNFYKFTLIYMLN